MSELLQLAGKRWVAGLTWRTYETTPQRATAVATAGSKGANSIAIRRDVRTPQVGYGHLLVKPRNASALAPAVAASHEAPWIGLFTLDAETSWLVAIGRDGAVWPDDGDVIGPHAELSVRMGRLLTADTWLRVTGQAEDLDKLVASSGQTAVHVASLYERPKWVLPVTLLTVAALGAGYWFIKHERARLAEERMRAAQAQRFREAQRLARISPVATAPLPSTWLRSCLSAAAPMPLSSNGWRLSGWHCDAHALSIAWHRERGGTVAQRPDGELSADGETVVGTQPLGALQDRGNTQEPATPPVHTFLALTQATGATPVLTRNAPSPVGLSGPMAQLITNPGGWTHFSLDMPITPSGVRWDEVWGLRFTQLGRTDRGYHLEGDIYER